MSPTRLVERQKRVVAELAQLVDQRAQAAQAVDDGFRAAERSTTTDYEHSLAHAAAQLQADEGAAEQTLRTARQSLTTAWESSSKSIENECQRAVETLVKRINRGERHAHKAMDETRWLARTVYEAGRKREAQKVAEVQQQLRGRMRGSRHRERGRRLARTRRATGRGRRHGRRRTRRCRRRQSRRAAGRDGR